MVETDCGHPIGDVEISEVISHINENIYLRGECSCGKRLIVYGDIDGAEIEGTGTVDI